MYMSASSSGRLTGRVALVTGAGRGIGAAVARAFAAEGASVVVSDAGVAVDGSGTDAGPAATVVEEIERAGGIALSDTTNVTDYDGCAAMIERAVSTYGGLDILVNAAGILRDRMIFNLNEDDWDVVIDVHLKGTYNTTRHAASYWRAHKDEGDYRLVNFTSGSGLFGAPTQPNYAAAKMGIVGLTLSCANSLSRYGVRCNAVAPVAGTRMTMSQRPEVYEADIMSPENVAPAVVYLASSESGWLNGRIIWSGGGRIGLVSNPAIEREVVRNGVWSNEDVFAEFENTFRPAVENRSPFGG
jgi:NAD(P)-dependent dehydrogenase (short-subunit alcohol dehydrogenase family)